MSSPAPPGYNADPKEDSGRMNGIIMGIIYLLVFIPGTILLSILLRKAHVTFRKGGPSQLVLVFLSMLSIFCLRIIMALIFLLGFATPAFATPAADCVYNYWIPTICIILENSALLELLSLWDSIIQRVARRHVLRRGLLIAARVVYFILIIVSLISLIVLRPTGAAGPGNPRLYEAFTYRITFFSFAIASTVFILACFSAMSINLRNHNRKAEDVDPEVQTFTNRIVGFSFVIAVVLVIRFILEIIVAVMQPSAEIILRVLEMLLHALPELILVYTFIGLSWKRVFSTQLLTEQQMTSRVTSTNTTRITADE